MLMSTTHQDMRNAIMDVIANEIPQGRIFDAHAVIQFIKKENEKKEKDENLYLKFCNGLEEKGAPHGRMSRILTLISEEQNSPIEYVGLSWSANMHGNFDNEERKCWRKK